MALASAWDNYVHSLRRQEFIHEVLRELWRTTEEALNSMPNPSRTQSQPKTMLVIAALILIGIYSSVSIASAQTSHTNTTTEVTSIYSTNTILTTITSPTITYTTTTETVNSTVGQTQTVTQSILTTITSTYNTVVGGTVTTTIMSVATQVSTTTTQFLGNALGESLALILLAAAVASFVGPKLLSRPPRGRVCSNCGTRNPPFAKGFCVKCGHSLKEK